MNPNVLGGAAAVGLCLGIALANAASAQAASTVTSQLHLFEYDTALSRWGGELRKTVSGAYAVKPDQTFGVQVWFSLSGGNFTDDSPGRSPETRNQPLGMRGTVFDLLTTGGPPGVLEPIVGTATTPPRWRYFDLTPSREGWPWVNLLDMDADGDLDAAGAGFGLHNFEAEDVQSLRRFQFGIDPTEVAAPSTPLLMPANGGLYKANSLAGSGTRLAISMTSDVAALIMHDPVDEDNSLRAKRADAIVADSVEVVVRDPGAQEFVAATEQAYRTPLGSATAEQRGVAAITLTEPAAEGSVDVSAVLDLLEPGLPAPQSVLVVMKLVDSEPDAGPGIAEALAGDPAFLAAADSAFQELAQAYPFLADGQGAVFELPADRVLSFDFNDTGGLKVQFIAVTVPEPAAILGCVLLTGLLRRRC
jgi:hypothetical protein